MLIIHVPFSLQRAARGNFDNVHTCNAAAPFQLDVRASSPHASPRFARQFCYILDGESLVDWNAFLLHPPYICGFDWFVDNFVHRIPPFVAIMVSANNNQSLILVVGLNCQAGRISVRTPKLGSSSKSIYETGQFPCESTFTRTIT